MIISAPISPGAVHVTECLFRMHTGTIPVRWLSPEIAEGIIRGLGIHDGHSVIVLTDGVTGAEGFSSGTAGLSATGDGFEAAFVAYSLARFGHAQICILDGGLTRWVLEDRPLTQEFTVTCPSGYTVTVREEFFIGYPELLRIKDQPGVVLLDSRPTSAYTGKTAWIKPGHIPGAVNIPAQYLMDEHNTALLKSPHALRQLFRARGITPDQTVICSCGTGRVATMVFLVLKYLLGYPDVVMFEGGFTEWVSYPDNPVVTGQAPR